MRAVKFFTEVFVTLLVIIDPAGTVPLFLGLTRGRSARTRHMLAWQAAAVAFGVIVAFALFGQTILHYLGVGLPALEGAGGLLLLLVALELLTGKSSEPTSEERARTNVAFVPLGTPLLADPDDLPGPVELVDAPFVEGVVAATVTAAAGADIAAVRGAAEEAWHARKL